MFEECFSMIELNGLMEGKSASPTDIEEDQLFHYISRAVVYALEEALFEQDRAPHSIH